MRKAWRRLLWTAGTCGAALLLFGGWEVYNAQRADYGWRPHVTRPRLTAEHPIVVIDEAHNNASTGAWSGRYWPLARLLRADGCTVERGRTRFTAQSLAKTSILVIANASGQYKPQLLGINLPVKRHGQRSDPAFTAAEIAAVREWVERGGSLLLVADHAPFGTAAAGLAEALGVRMHQGFLSIPGERDDPLVFSGDRLGTHPILDGGAIGERVRKVMTYTGQSLDGPPGSLALLRVPKNGVESVEREGSFVEQPAGEAQAIAFTRGNGRVVVLGEAAMITAQVSRRVPFGMNTPDNDNAAFALNVVRWLARKI